MKAQDISCKRGKKVIVEKRGEGKKETVYSVAYSSRSCKWAAGVGIISAQHTSRQHPRCWQSFTGTPPPHKQACVSSLPLCHPRYSCGGGAGGFPGRDVTCPLISPVLFHIHFLRALSIDSQEHHLEKKKKREKLLLNINCIFLFIFLQRET